jgi:hypothetical protein
MLLGGAAAWPLAARAQQTGKMSRIGYLGSSSPSLEPHYVEAFRQKLRDLGHVEGENIAIEYRWAEGQDDRLPNLATELVRLNPDVIVTTPQHPQHSPLTGGRLYRRLHPALRDSNAYRFPGAHYRYTARVCERAHVERNCRTSRPHSKEHELAFKQAGCLWDHRQSPPQPRPKGKHLSRTTL